jgi:hypothetical protein
MLLMLQARLEHSHVAQQLQAGQVSCCWRLAAAVVRHCVRLLRQPGLLLRSCCRRRCCSCVGSGCCLCRQQLHHPCLCCCHCIRLLLLLLGRQQQQPLLACRLPILLQVAFDC